MAQSPARRASERLRQIIKTKQLQNKRHHAELESYREAWQELSAAFKGEIEVAFSALKRDQEAMAQIADPERVDQCRDRDPQAFLLCGQVREDENGVALVAVNVAISITVNDGYSFTDEVVTDRFGNFTSRISLVDAAGETFWGDHSVVFHARVEEVVLAQAQADFTIEPGGLVAHVLQVPCMEILKDRIEAGQSRRASTQADQKDLAARRGDMERARKVLLGSDEEDRPGLQTIIFDDLTRLSDALNEEMPFLPDDPNLPPTEVVVVECPAGPKGDPGEKGDPGPAGPQGERGEPGAAGKTGSKGNRGAVGPKGDQGDQGEPGSAGSQGERGEPGATGKTGSKGNRGVAGPKGDQGEPGMAGPQGERGEPGPTGKTGSKGDRGAVGPKGDQGDTGPMGEKGDMGADGSKGRDGATGAKGDQGDPGPAGPKGEKGDTGEPGLSGRRGTRGATGPKGDTGSAGPKGDRGDTGEPGPSGRRGARGAAGPKGDPGPAGPKGEKGDKGDPGEPGDSANEPWVVSGRVVERGTDTGVPALNLRLFNPDDVDQFQLETTTANDGSFVLSMRGRDFPILVEQNPGLVIEVRFRRRVIYQTERRLHFQPGHSNELIIEVMLLEVQGGGGPSDSLSPSG